MTLAETLLEIKRLKKLAKEDVETGNIATMNARRSRKRNAIEALKEQKNVYKRELMRTSLFIVVTGSTAEQFKTIANKNFHTLSADPDLFYKDLASRVPSALIKKSNTSIGDIFDVLGRHMEDKALELDIIGYPQLIFKQTYRKTIVNKEDLVSLVKQAINEQVGSEIVGIQSVNAVVDQAIKKNHKAPISPLVLTVEDEAFALELNSTLRKLTNRVVLVSSGVVSEQVAAITGQLHAEGEELQKEAVGEVLKTIKQLIK